ATSKRGNGGPYHFRSLSLPLPLGQLFIKKVVRAGKPQTSTVPNASKASLVTCS
ncbi:hypothetical protein ACHAXS_012021, partial [Conticribra weissflogii]